MALVAIDGGNGEMLGAVRLLADANFDRGEYGIMVRSDLKGAGIGWRLMEGMIEVAHWLGLNVIEGQVLRENSTMLSMCRHLGFDVVPDPEDTTVMLVTLPVTAALPAECLASVARHQARDASGITRRRRPAAHMRRPDRKNVL